MNMLLIEATEDSPKIYLNKIENKAIIKGRSYMEDVAPFRDAMIDWFREHIPSTKSPFLIEINLEYVNTSSQQMLMQIISELNKYFLMGCPVQIQWYYEHDDEFIKEMILEFKNDFDLPIEAFRL